MNALRLLSVVALATAFVVPLSPSDAAAAPTCQGVAATIVGTPRDDRLLGTAGRDVIVAGDGDDTVLGRGGDDLVCGGDGADTLRGGPGDDRLYGQRDSIKRDRGGHHVELDVLEGGPGDDLLDIGDDDRRRHGPYGVLDYTRAAAGVMVDLAAGTATGQGDDILILVSGARCLDCYDTEVLGSAHDDVISGTSARDMLVGNAGDDHIDGRGGRDRLYADGYWLDDLPASDDVVVGGAGDDSMSAEDGRDRLTGNGGDDYLSGSSGLAELHGGPGDDGLRVSFGSEPGFLADGGPGHDRGILSGLDEAGADQGLSAATVTMGDGRVVANQVERGRLLNIEDVALWAQLRWTYEGTDAPDIVSSLGTSLHARTYGGDDQITGTVGRDWIDAGDGTDKVVAFGGRDTCLNAEEHDCELISSGSVLDGLSAAQREARGRLGDRG